MACTITPVTFAGIFNKLNTIHSSLKQKQTQLFFKIKNRNDHKSHHKSSYNSHHKNIDQS